ncbi:MAG: sugar ABC transporter substrate-binding protein, partial [Spirochaetales bacterium]|nr:sugar ABC transporter substrate-binding protein [Spirochaetales bacterium]
MTMTMHERWNVRGALAAIAALVFLLSAAGLAASPEPEVAPAEQDFTIGAFYTTLETGYFFQGVRYQCFDRSHQRVLTQMAQEEGFGLETYDLSVDLGISTGSLAGLAGQEVSGAIVCQAQPLALGRFLRELREEDIPVVLHGIRNPQELPAPYVDHDGLTTGRKLGNATATHFEASFPGEKPRVLIANTRTIERNRKLEEGFIIGFREILPEAEFQEVRDDQGSVLNAQEMATLALIEHPEANVFVGTSDFRTTGIMHALRSRGRGTPETEVVASIGGSEEAMRALLDPNSAWKVQAGLAVGDMAREGYNLLREMMRGSRPGESDIEMLVKAEILVVPSFEEVAA